MTIDSHQHFWTYSPGEYPWIEEDMEPLRRDHGPEDLKPLLDAAGVAGTIAVQARASLEENDALLALAGTHGWIRGVVGWVDLTRDNAGEILASLAEREKFVGVREVLQGMADDDYCMRDDFNRGVSRLHPLGLAYDILVYPRHLGNAVHFVDSHPSQVFVLDHVAKPAIRFAAPDPVWAGNLRALGMREHVYCKLSGLVTEVAAGLDWTPELLRPYFDVALDAFGPERLMFGSDWPVCRLRSDYLGWKTAVDGWAAGLSAEERASLFGGAAARAYGLD